ncbi:PhpK family radical SAM P-methyltransferase, partial [Candidatus Entotheonella serta]
MVMIDCLIVGFNDSNFADYVQTVKVLGVDSGAYRDLSLAFLEYEGRHYRALDILTHLHPNDDVYFANTDFLWPTITYLGSYLSKHGFSFDYINEFQRDTELFREKLQQNDILTIAITTTLYVLPDPILEVVNFIRQYNKTVKIIIGGPYICNQFESLSELEFQSLFHYLSADIYVNNREGEATLVDILSALKHGDDLSEVKNISYKIGDEYKTTHSEVESNDLEDNMVNYTLFPKRDIGQFVSLRTAKSCPFSCAFCGFPARAGKYVYTSVDHVEKELNALKELGTVTTLTFLDDTFNVPKKRFADILQMMIRNQYEFKWNSFFRSDHGDESIIELMKEAGCEGVFLGTESGSNTILEKMNKTAR